MNDEISLLAYLGTTLISMPLLLRRVIDAMYPRKLSSPATRYSPATPTRVGSSLSFITPQTPSKPHPHNGLSPSPLSARWVKLAAGGGIQRLPSCLVNVGLSGLGYKHTHYPGRDVL